MKRTGLACNVVLAKLSLIFLLFVVSTAVYSESNENKNEPTEGFEYKAIEKPLSLSAGSKVEVVEMFCYGCPHCYNMENYLKNWLSKKPENVEFKRKPALFFPWMPKVSFKARCIHYAKVHMIAEEMGVSAKIDEPLWNEIYVNDNDLDSVDSIAGFLAKLGVDREKFKKLYESPEMEKMITSAEEFTTKSGIERMPSFIVDGKYWTSVGYAGGEKEVFAVIDFLVKKAALERLKNRETERKPTETTGKMNKVSQTLNTERDK
jgi:protein dithiol oxidoreductase (disulfide-forming)